MSCLYRIQDTKSLNFERGVFVFNNIFNINQIVDVRSVGLKRLLFLSRLGTRLFRLEPRCVERIDEKRFVVCQGHKVWLLNVAQKTFSMLQKSREGFSDPLNLCSDGDNVYWGDYGDNAYHKDVHIYRLTPNLRIEVVYSFSSGVIRHVHNVIWDKVHKRFFILTGDLEEKAGIYVADKDWETVEPIVTGSQQYRAVIAFPCSGGLIYATDSVEENNNIYLLKDGMVKALAPFPGSCIYGTETKDYYVFSSTVEPPEGRGVLDMFTYKIGAGIQDRYAHLLTVRKSDLEVREVLKVRKDFLPMKLFQYGSLTFPKGQESSNELWYNIVACNGDGEVMRIASLDAY